MVVVAVAAYRQSSQLWAVSRFVPQILLRADRHRHPHHTPRQHPREDAVVQSARICYRQLQSHKRRQWWRLHQEPAGFLTFAPARGDARL